MTPCAKIATSADWAEYVRYWQDEFNTRKAVIGSLQDPVALERHREFRLTRLVRDDIDSILYAVKDTLMPRDFDHFLQEAFDLPPN